MCIAVHLNIESVWQQLTSLYIGFLSLGVFLSAGKAREYLDNYCYLSLSPEKNLAAPPDSAQSMHTALVVIHIEM